MSDITVVDLPTLLKRSDIITLHVALNSQTLHVIGKQEFELMRPDAFFINTSRGAVVAGNAINAAAKTVRAKILKLASQVLEAPEDELGMPLLSVNPVESDLAETLDVKQ